MGDPDTKQGQDDTIQYSSKAMKGRQGLPGKVAQILPLLEQDLRETGGKPYGRGWDSLGEVSTDAGETAMHCHLTYRYSAVWKILQAAGKIICRFIYIGTREKAPY